MKSYDVVGYVPPEGGYVLCPAHAPAEAFTPDSPWGAVFADSEWDCFPVCDMCGERITDVSLTEDGIEYEHNLAQDCDYACPVPYCGICLSEKEFE